MIAVTPDLLDACRAEYPVRLGVHDLVFVGLDLDGGVLGGTFQMMTWDGSRRALVAVTEQHVALLRLPDEVAPGIVRVAGLRLAIGEAVTHARIARHFTALAHEAPTRFASALANGDDPAPAAALIGEG